MSHGLAQTDHELACEQGSPGYMNSRALGLAFLVALGKGLCIVVDLCWSVHTLEKGFLNVRGAEFSWQLANKRKHNVRESPLSWTQAPFPPLQSCLSCCFFFFGFLRQSFCSPENTYYNSLCRPEWPWTQRSACHAFQVLGLKVCTARPSILLLFLLVIWNRVSCNPGWPQACCAVEGDL